MISCQAANQSHCPYSQACVMCTISIAYISAISKPIHFWFSPKLSAVQGYKPQVPRTCGPISKLPTSTLKIREEAPPLFWGGAGSPFNTKFPGLRPTSIPSGILMHPTVWPQQKRAEYWEGGGEPPFCGGSWVPI